MNLNFRLGAERLGIMIFALVVISLVFASETPLPEPIGTLLTFGMALYVGAGVFKKEE